MYINTTKYTKKIKTSNGISLGSTYRVDTQPRGLGICSNIRTYLLYNGVVFNCLAILVLNSFQRFQSCGVSLSFDTMWCLILLAVFFVDSFLIEIAVVRTQFCPFVVLCLAMCFSCRFERLTPLILVEVSFCFIKF